MYYDVRCSKYVRHLMCDSVGQLYDVDVWMNCADGSRQCSPYSKWFAKEINIHDSNGKANYRFSINYPFRNISLQGISRQRCEKRFYVFSIALFLLFSICETMRDRR